MQQILKFKKFYNIFTTLTTDQLSKQLNLCSFTSCVCSGSLYLSSKYFIFNTEFQTFNQIIINQKCPTASDGSGSVWSTVEPKYILWKLRKTENSRIWEAGMNQNIQTVNWILNVLLFNLGWKK